MQKVSKAFFVLSLFITISCNGQEKSQAQTKESVNDISNTNQIGEYVVSLFEDSKGNMWFGTLEKGVARYDGENLRYFTKKDGLPSNSVTGVIEDTNNTLWLGTRKGLVKYLPSGGKSNEVEFITYGKEHGLGELKTTSLFIDSKQIFWVGTWDGVYTFDGESFSSFPLPIFEVEREANDFTQNWITEIMEDSKGNIWIGRDTYGAAKYDGKEFTHFTRKDGLYSTNVREIEEDSAGNIWFGTRVAEKDNADPKDRFGPGGVTFYNGNTFSHFPEIAGLNESDVYSIFKDKAGKIWVSTTSEGIYKYDGKEFINYKVTESANDNTKAVMSIYEDSKGNIWLGCPGGLYKLNGDGMKNITTNGPWK